MQTAAYTRGSSPATLIPAGIGWARAIGRALALVLLTSASNLHCRARVRFADDPLSVAIRLSGWLSQALIHILGVRVEIRGGVPAGTVLLVSNHRSYADVPVLMAHISAVFLAKAEIADWPFFGTAARLAHTIFVKREERPSRKAALAAISRMLDDGRAVTVFPEGTTSREAGTGPFRPGSFYLAVAKGIRVVPVAIAYGSPEDAWVGDDNFFRHFFERFRLPRMRVLVAIGPPLRGDDGAVLRDAAHEWISRRVERLEAELGTRTGMVADEEDGDRGIGTGSVLIPTGL